MEYNVNRYIKLLLEENTRQNLVSRKSIDDELAKHIEDSLKILDYISLENKNIVDIGSGAGFPALVLGISCPTASFTLVESDLKKSTFLETVKTALELNNVNVIRTRAEELGQNQDYRGSFDICTCRAVAAMNILLEYALPLLKPGGRLLLWKGRNYQQEITEAQKALELLDGKVTDNYLYNLMEDRDRAIVVVEKQGTTPAKYPRRVGIPAKRPL